MLLRKVAKKQTSYSQTVHTSGFFTFSTEFSTSLCKLQTSEKVQKFLSPFSGKQSKAVCVIGWLDALYCQIDPKIYSLFAYIKEGSEMEHPSERPQNTRLCGVFRCALCTSEPVQISRHTDGKCSVPHRRSIRMIP